MTMTRLIFTVLISTIIGCSTTGSPYGRWEHFSRETILKFPDFELYYLGIAHNAHIRIIDTMRWTIAHNFEARQGEDRVPLTWSSGLGDIGPTIFEIGGRKYFLEMTMPELLNDHAPEPAIAVWPEDEWESRRHPWWRIW